MTIQAKKHRLVPEDELPGAAPQQQGSSGLQKLATGVRYGPPIATALTGAGIPASAGVAAASEFAAQKLEELDKTGDIQWADLNTNLEDLFESTIAGGSEAIGMKYLGPVGEWLTKKIANTPYSLMKRLFMPAEEALTPEGAITGKVLEKLGSHAPASILTGGKGSEAMFEDMLRAAFFSAGKWAKFDELNEGLVLDAIQKYSGKLSEALPPSAWGERLTGMLIGSGKDYKLGMPKGELGFARDIRNTLYQAMRDLTDEAGDRFEAKGLSAFLEKEGSRDEVKSVMMEIGNHLRVSVKTADPAIEKDLAAMPKHMAALVRKALGDDPTIGTMNVGDAVELRKLLNGITKDPNQPMAVKGVANHLLKDYISPELDNALAANPAARKALDTADSFFGKSADLLESKVVKHIYDEMLKSPDALFQYIGKAGNPTTGILGVGKEGLVRLEALEKAFTQGMPSRLNRAMYEDAVIKPIQTAYFRQTADAMGRIQGTKLVRLFQPGNEFAEKVYGKEQMEAIRELAIALKSTQHIGKSGSVLMQLTQGGMVVRGLKGLAMVGGAGVGGYAAGGGSGAMTGAAAAGATIFLSPVVLTKWLTNPATVRKIAQGIQLGPTNARFHAAVATLAAINASEKVDLQHLNKLGDKASDFYSRSVEPEALMEAAGQQAAGGNYGPRGGAL